MKRLLLLLFAATAIYAQNPETAAFPSAVADDEDLLCWKNGATTTLNGTINDSTLTVVLTDATNFCGPGVITIENERLKVCSISTNTLTICSGGRGFDNSTAASHTSGVTVSGYVPAYWLNQMAAEIKSIESQLGASLGNILTPSNTKTVTNKTIDGESNVIQVRQADTDCTAETGGKVGELCLELDADTLYSCQPTSGDCDTAGEWILISGSVGASALDDLSDVTLTTETTDDTLKYNGSVWVNVNLLTAIAQDLANAGCVLYENSGGIGCSTAFTFDGTGLSVGTAGANFLVAEGATADAFETTFAVTDPTADRTITFPDATGTVPLLDDAVTFTNKTLTTPVITGKVDRNNVSVDDDDCTGEQGLYWYDTTDSAFEFCNANSGTPTVLSGDGAETNALESDGASGIADTEVFIGTGSGTGNYAAISGDATLANTGALTIASNAVALGTDTTGNYISTAVAGSGVGSSASGEGAILYLGLDYSKTLASDGSIGAAGRCQFTLGGSNEGGFLCEGTAVDTNEQYHLFVSSNGADTTDYIVTTTATNGYPQLTSSTPSASTDACTAGTIWFDASYIYVCNASGDIRRATLATF